MIELLREADLFVLPAKDAASGDRDGLPNVLLEAASQRLAIVATEFAGIPEFIRPGREGELVAAGRLGGAVERDQPPGARSAPRARLSASAAYERLRRDFGIGRTIDLLEARFRALLRRPRDAPAASGKSREPCATAVPIAFYAPMKSPDHPAPSGDRTMARLLLKALARGRLRARSSQASCAAGTGCGDAAFQDEVRRSASLAEAERLIARWTDARAGERPRLWFTYHVYYKAPDWIGPRVADASAFPTSSPRARAPASARGGAWALGACRRRGGARPGRRRFSS